MSRVAVAIAGAGYMGQSHAEAYNRLGDTSCHVKYVFSRTFNRASKLAARLGATPLTDLTQIMKDHDVQAVDISLPTPLHYSVAMSAIEAGKHVFLEKPISLSIQEAEHIIEAASDADVHLQIGFVLRFWPEYVRMQQALASSEYGQVTAFVGKRLSPKIDWNDWMLDPSQSGGAACDLLIHDFDQAQLALGRPQAVYAGGSPDGLAIRAVVQHAGGSSFLEASMTMPPSYPFTSYARFDCSGGSIEYLFRPSIGSGVGNVGATSSADDGILAYPTDGDVDRLSVSSSENPFAAQVRYFIDGIRYGRRPERATGEQARAALALALAANASLESGNIEEVDA